MAEGFISNGGALGYPEGTQIGNYYQGDGFFHGALRHPDGRIQALSPGSYRPDLSDREEMNKSCYSLAVRSGLSYALSEDLCWKAKTNLPAECGRHLYANYGAFDDGVMNTLSKYHFPRGDWSIEDLIDVACDGVKNSIEIDCRWKALKLGVVRYSTESLCFGARSLSPIDCFIGQQKRREKQTPPITEFTVMQDVDHCWQGSLDHRFKLQKRIAEQNKQIVASLSHYYDLECAPSGEIDGGYCE